MFFSCFSDFVVPRCGLYDVVSDRAILSYQRWRVRDREQWGVWGLWPTELNVTGFPEPFLAFYEWESMENYIICFLKLIHYCNKDSVCFPLFFFFPLAKQSMDKSSWAPLMQRQTWIWKQSQKYLLIGTSVPITKSKKVSMYLSLIYLLFCIY